jgi:transposase
MLVQVYGDNAMKKRAVQKWVKRFTEGRESVTDEERLGRPATSRTEENIAKASALRRKAKGRDVENKLSVKMLCSHSDGYQCHDGIRCYVV